MRALSLNAFDLFGPLFARPVRVARVVPANETSDQELVSRMLRGDRWAEEAFYRRHVVTVTATVMRLLGHRQDAEEVVQDTFIAALQELPRLREPAAVRGWLLTIAVRKVHRRFRRRKLLRALGLDRSLDDVTLEAVAAPGTTGEMRSELAALDRALSRAPADARIAWMLRYVDGEQLEDVAKICEVSLSTAKRRIAAVEEIDKAHAEEGSQ